jgi:hypothetical protein
MNKYNAGDIVAVNNTWARAVVADVVYIGEDFAYRLIPLDPLDNSFLYQEDSLTLIVETEEVEAVSLIRSVS